jgi:hypothetical protein
VSFRYLIASAALVLSGPALAQLPAPLEQALSVIPDELAPQGIVMRMTLSGESVRIAVSYEGEDGPNYRLIEPSSEAMLSEVQAEMWAGFNQDDEEEAAEPAEDADADADNETTASLSVGDYDPDALRASIGDAVTLLSEEGGRLIYEFDPQNLPGQSGAPDAMIEHLRGEVEVDPALGQLSAIRYELVDSFKPNLAARIERFEMEQRFVNEPALNGPRSAGVSMTMAGSAMFQRFSQTMRFDIEEMRFDDASVEALEAAAESP